MVNPYDKQRNMNKINNKNERICKNTEVTKRWRLAN